MLNKNIGNYATFGGYSLNVPELIVSGSMMITGDANFTGNTTFTTINITELDASLLLLGSTNTSDTIDIGIYGKYDDGTTKYSGLFKDFSDTEQLWKLFKDITTQPTTTVSGVSTNELDSLQLNSVYLNNGSATEPAIRFSADPDIGIYRSASGIGFSVDGVIRFEITTAGPSQSSDFSLSDGTALMPSLTFTSSSNTGFYWVESETVGLSAGGSLRLSVGSDETSVFNDFQTNAGRKRHLTVDATTSRTLSNTDDIVEFSNTGTVNVSLPECNSANQGRQFLIVKTGATGSVIINTFDSNDFIDEPLITSKTLNNQYDKIELLCNGVNGWYAV